MARNLTPTALAASFASQTDEVFIVLLELSHPSFAETIRLCSNDQNVEHKGNIYSRFPFEVGLPDEEEETPPRVVLRIDNVDRRIVAEIRRVTGVPISISFFVVLASSPSLIEAGPFDFSLRDVEYDAATIEGTLVYEDVLAERFPGDEFTPARFPGLF